jgi:AraC-like DNA-binding protein
VRPDRQAELRADLQADPQALGPAFHFVPPIAPLRGWVRQHQVIRLRFPAGTVVPTKPYWPRPAAALAFYPRDRERIGMGRDAPSLLKPRAALIGQPTVLTQRQGGHDFSVYQIEFEPGALYRLTGLPLDRLSDTCLDAESVLPSGFRSLVDRIEDLDDPVAQVAAAEAWLLGLVARSRWPAKPGDRIASRLLEDPAADLEDLARRHGVVARHLRRQFDQRVGVGPKLFARIARFDRLVRAANRAPDEHWLGLALDAGYHDHRHLARDFRQFTLATPGEFVALEARSPERGFGFCE